MLLATIWTVYLPLVTNIYNLYGLKEKVNDLGLIDIGL